MKIMTKSLAALTLTLLGTAAQAETFNWDGWYAGLSLGNNHSTTDWNTTDYLAPNATPTLLTGNGHASLGDDALLVDAHVGYNWTIAPDWIAGVELHAGHAGNDDTQYPIPGINRGGAPGIGGYSSVQAEGSWNDSLRGRIGYAFAPGLLAYATAGMAMADIKTTVTCPQDTNVCNPAFAPLENSNKDRAYGYIAGVGIEMALADHLSGRIEYTYADYGTVSVDGLPALSNRSFGFNGDVDLTNQALTAGITYHF